MYEKFYSLQCQTSFQIQMKLLRRKQTRYLINISLFLILSFVALTFSQQTTHPILIQDIPFNFSKKIHPNKQNPPAPLHSTSQPSDSLYVMILDQEYEPQDFHCLMDHQWVETLRDQDFVDGVEIYSLNGWKHKDCDLQTVTVQSPPKQMKDPSSWQIYKSFELFLERSNSDWLFLVGDATYINTIKFFNFFNDIKHNNPQFAVARGGCIEQRYFFQLLEISSGIIFSRTAIKKILQLDVHWNTTFSMEMRGEEALGHAINNIGLYVPHQVADGFVGNEFFSPKDYNILMNKNFDTLTKCVIRNELHNPNPGQQGNCVKHVQKFQDIFSWAGGGKTHKKEFLENAEVMIDGIDSKVGVIWEKIKPKLCKIE